MMFYELMPGIVQADKGFELNQPGNVFNRKSGSNSQNMSFNNILKKSMTYNGNTKNEIGLFNLRSNQIRGDKAVSREDAAKIEGNRQNKEYLTFRERIKDNAKTGFDSKPDDARYKNDESVKSEDEADVRNTSERRQTSQTPHVLDIFAQILGLNTADLQNILEECSIDPDSFDNRNSLYENAYALSQILGLNVPQRETLVKMLIMADEAIESLSDAQMAEIGGSEFGDGNNEVSFNSLADDVKNTAGSSIPDVNPQSAGLGKLLAELKNKISEKLNEYAVRLEADESGVLNELRGLNKSMLENVPAKYRELLRQEPELGIDGAPDVEISEKALDAKAGETDSDNGNEGTDENVCLHKETKIADTSDDAIENRTQEVFSAFLIDRPEINRDIGAYSPEIVYRQNEIIDQVINNAKLILSGDKSEMIMNLKPNSLGKISLKVVTENGIVTARFVAENQQVKQVLESNMELLKDSLEKQGLNVQGFSVSVGQDSDKPGWNMPEPGRTASGRAGDRNYGNEDAGVPGELEVIQLGINRRDPYHWDDNTINLTA